MSSLPPDGDAAAADDISRTELLPFLLPFSDLRKRVYLWPGLTLAVFVAALLALAGLKEENGFFWVLASFIWLGTLYLVYLACGQKQPFFYVLLIAVLAFWIN